ncbi:tape measure domain protein (plasmid) [Borreliella burgdorferi 29805]|uniref:tape measure protein n=1 Tax=Borreliella burgdorferi TaxID=139 RepID=UPI00017F3B18|nr:tape measure protein [Borreliella burgdorferi]ACO38635.1 tape measure domain protein [Borreliella burgdorferi 29805]MCD2322158.1 tape measure protein [Borreliella burgdorferi]MCD2372436.1 tape measure protein [Borreliella burgdorferi]MCD2376670.1 tape measure protein [Borreliella burgdorferi]MCD2377308.1 tape measure protein [Borreliella burgdorferi]
MKLDEIIIPLSMSISNNQKLDAIAETLKKIAEQKFSSLDDLKSKLEKSAKSGSNLEKALNKSSQNASKNFKSLADSVDSVNSKAGSMKSIGKVLKSVGKGLGSVKNLANKTGEAFNQMLAAFAPIIIAVKAIQAIGSTISGIFDGAMDALDEFNEEVSTFSDMLGNEDLGKSLAESMRAFGDETLFTRDAIANATKTMLSYGATASEVEERIRMFGEAAGGSSEGLEKLAEVYSRVESSNQVNLEDLYALRDAGVDITDILAEEAGLAGEALYKAASDGKIGFDALNKALSKATSEGGKFYGNTAKEAKTLAQAQQQTAKMSEKLFLDIGKALEPMMIGFEKVKQFLMVAIMVPLTKVTTATIYLTTKLGELVAYLAGKWVQGMKMLFKAITTPFVKLYEGIKYVIGKLKELATYVSSGFLDRFKGAFEPIIKWVQKLIDMISKAYTKLKNLVTFWKEAEKEKDTSGSEPERDKKFDPNAKTNLNKKMAEDYQKLQDEIFNRQRDIYNKIGKEREQALRNLEKTIKEKNQQFMDAYSKSFDELSDENKKILVGVEKSVNEFNNSNYYFVNEYQNLLKEKESREREIIKTLPHTDQVSALQKLNDEINEKNKAFVEKYGKSFETLNESNRQVVVALEKQVNEYEKTALDRSFVEAQKALQKEITDLEWETMLLPAKERASAEKKMASKIQAMYKKFVDEHKSQFEKLNETNRNTIKQYAEKAQDTTKSLYDSMIDGLNVFMNAFMKDIAGKFLNKDTGESIGEEFHNLINGEDVNWGEGLEKMSTQMYESWKTGLKTAAGAFFGPAGTAIAELITGLTDFVWGFFKGQEKARIKAIEKKRDEDLEELEKRSEVELKKLEDRFDEEIKMRKEKLSELDDEYTKEIEFLKQAQSKGQISGEEFQKRLHDVQTEYKTKKDIETTQLTKTEEAKKLEVERKNKLSKLEPERIKAQAEVDKVNAEDWWNLGKPDRLRKTQKILDEILKRIAKVKSAGSIEEIKLAHGGARFVSNKPTYMPNSGVMSSEFGQPELVRITPAPIDENLRKLEAKIIAEEITKLQKTQSSTVVNNFYYNFNGDVLDAEKLVRMLKSKEHLMAFRMAE